MMNVDADTTLDEAYAALRRSGTLYVPAARAASVVAGMRRRAAADGLAITAYRRRRKNLTGNQADNRSTTIHLTSDDGHTVVAPDSEAPRA